MEIEAKFAVLSQEVFDQLRSVSELAGFSLAPGRSQRLYDTYLDTETRAILAKGYACRRRELEGNLSITLKAVKRVEGAIHRREEWEVQLPADLPPAQWPDGPVRARVLRWAGEAPLQPLFDLRQVRTVRAVNQGERQVADLSLDEVQVAAGDRKQAYFELEVELKPEGSEAELTAIAACLQSEWGLCPENRSKFERALLFVSEADEKVEGRLLTAEARAVCQRLAKRADLHGRRARALLALDAGASQAEAGRLAGMSERRARHWLAEFRRRGLDIFPARVLAEAQSEPSPADLESPPIESGQQPPPQPWPLSLLFERYGVDRSHAQSVANHALALFDHLARIHGVPPERRPLLEVAALVHNIGLVSDAHRHHIVGRDILLAHPPAGLNPDERQVVALTTFLHRRPVTAQGLEALINSELADWPADWRTQALALAALVRMADGLDYSQGNSRLVRIQQLGDRVRVVLTGPFAGVDAKRARHKSDLWQLLFNMPIEFEVAEAGELEAADLSPPGAAQLLVHEPGEPAATAEAEAEATAATLPDKPGLLPDDSMTEAARKVMLFHFQRMLRHEPGTRLGEDIEELHDMRVAVRRMRAAWSVFGDYLNEEEWRPFLKGLRRTGRMLGAVRDLDVFREKIQHYLDELPPARRDDLEPLLVVWQTQHDNARRAMLAYLDSERYLQFKEQFAVFLNTPASSERPVAQDGPDGVRPYRVRHVAPVALYQRLAEVRAYDEWLDQPDVPLERYHQLRIAGKGLRYTLEYFAEVLAPEAKVLIDIMKELQDHLGEVQDAVVACNLLRDFLTWGTWGHSPDAGRKANTRALVVAPGVAAYLAARQAELQQLLARFPAVWSKLRDVQFSRQLSAALSPL